MAVGGAELVINNIKSFGGGFLRHVNKTMTQVKNDLDVEITMSASLMDHSLADLRKMGHPYAKRHGLQGMHIHDPNWLVHTQGGSLLASKYSGIDEASVENSKLHAGAFVGLNPNIAEHAPYVIFGTSKMIPRDFLTGSLLKAKDQLVLVIQNNLRDAVLNFKAQMP
jgi:hypothetical protein